VNLEEGIKKQRKLLAIIHDACSPCNPGYYDERNELPVYKVPQEELDKLFERFDKLSAELFPLAMKQNQLGSKHAQT